MERSPFLRIHKKRLPVFSVDIMGSYWCPTCNEPRGLVSFTEEEMAIECECGETISIPSWVRQMAASASKRSSAFDERVDREYLPGELS